MSRSRGSYGEGSYGEGRRADLITGAASLGGCSGNE